MNKRKCKLCGSLEFVRTLDIEPAGMCGNCWSDIEIPDHIPDKQEMKYYKMLIKKKEKNYG